MEQPQAQPQAPTTALLARSMLAEADGPTPEQQAPVEAEQQEAPQAETPEQPTEEAPQSQPEEEIVEWELEGQEVVKVPAKLRDYLMRDKDYRQKTMAVAEERKAVEASRAQLSQLTEHAQQIVQQAQQFAPVFGQVAAFDQQIQQIQQHLTPQLEQTDPVAYSNMGTKLFLLHQQKQQVIASAQAQMAQWKEQMSHVNAKAHMERQAQAVAEVRKSIKDFSPELGRKVGEYAAKSGLPQEALAFMDSSAPAFLLAWKASEYDRIQAEAKTSLKKVETAPPVAKPSARTQSSESKTRMEKLRDEFRKSGGKDANLSRAILREKLGLKE